MEFELWNGPCDLIDNTAHDYNTKQSFSFLKNSPMMMSMFSSHLANCLSINAISPSLAFVFTPLVATALGLYNID